MIRFVNTSGTLQSSNRRLFSMLDTTTIFTSHIYDLSIADVCLPPASSSKANGNYQTGIIETISRQQHFIIFH
jgi:hypothetical protein